MEFGKTSFELKVGVFVFIGLIILAAFVLSIGGIKTWSSGYKINVTFNFADGVKVGAPVRYAGVDVGQVKQIDFIYPELPGESGKVRLNCWVKDVIKIPVDSTVWINTLGLLGEKYVEVMPGKDYSRFMDENETVTGIEPIPMHEVYAQAKRIVNNVETGVQKVMNQEGTFGKFLFDDSIYKDLDAMILDIKNNPWKLFIRTKEKSR